MESSVSDVIKESNGSIIHPQEPHLKRSVEHSTGRFSCPIATMGLPFTLASDKMRADTSPSSEMEIIKEIGFPKIG